MTIQLPGYDALVPDKVYGRSTNLKVLDSKFDILSLLLPSVFIEPNEDKVISIIRRKAYEILPNWENLTKIMGLTDLGKWDSILLRFSKSSIENIANGCPEAIEQVRENTCAVNGGIPRKLLFFSYGVLPKKVIDAAGQDANNVFWYANALADPKLMKVGMGHRGKCCIKIDKNGLPPLEETEILLKHKTTQSEVLIVNSINYEPVEIARIVRSLYSGINSENISRLEDISELSAELEAVETIDSLSQSAELEETADTGPYMN